MPALDRGYHPAYDALVHCIRHAPWNPVDHLANLHEKLLIRESADEDPGRVWTFNVDHYRMEDSIWASVDGALAPDSHGAIRVLVLHTEVDSITRKCQSCGTKVGTGRVLSDALPGWAQQRPFIEIQKLGGTN